ncbi:armadillo repeat-containing protein 12 isoform X1 [Choloepus didactylus]|uniref:armadillo repeat-containing protein 12 isoform X1 n=1 Tax=Choloepus didactylus TaxID=27675 RepID=UPI00189F488A|nr:armadillo repeat-containing protein 12 isoform X1 [Choloepus didactylus]XP_037698594.1 armadillo repeat-containing protein 12 isoform X1 [Choloepus didactylus]XP_037698595.1 armadillo repeat-containing protein 12 isoform X1 [Choloepus didactylus]XP_037698596.1 armadillo repeat-containing protein 12 isoform X1 [Choloepus didactylus]XP_037698598.1 armadillo repeat-containing protein 12 isoform X1 [Choloepus didactylus]XP_037698599.1 armadillo repeat-containing protein 12 isoform X1 [Choloepus
MGMGIPECLEQLDIRRSIVGLATGAGAIYLLYKAIKAAIKCQPPICTTSPICIARLAIERERHGRDSGELRRLLNSLECKQDEYTKSMILHSITRCVYLLEAEASACTADDISLVSSMLDDKDNSVKIQALNTLKAFSSIRKFRLIIQEHSIKVLELISTIWDSELHIASLRLLNNLTLPDFVHPQLRRVMPALMEILQSDYILAQVPKDRGQGSTPLASPGSSIWKEEQRFASSLLRPRLAGPLCFILSSIQVQAIRLLSHLAQKNDLLYDILNCQVHSNFLCLFQSTQPGSLLFEVLVFAERLSEGRNSPHYRAVKWHYNEQSLHEALFGDESRLADRLLSLVIHPEEEVQIQACKVIVSLQWPPDLGARSSSCQPSSSYFNN